MRWVAAILWMLGAAWGSVAEPSRGATLWAAEEGSPALPGIVTVVVGHPEQTERLYAGSQQGFFVSDDAGAHWRRVLTLRGAVIHDVALAPAHPLVIYLATARGLYRSEDGGQQWRRRYGGWAEGDSDVLAVAVHPTDPEQVVIGTSTRGLLTRDGGKTWRPALLPMQVAPISAALYHPRDPTSLYLVTAAGLYRSRDGGDQWARVFRGATPGDVGGEATEDSS